MIPTLKTLIHQECLLLIDQRISHSTEAIAMAQESANEEGKSSAGDKHETGRAMAQLEQEKAIKQLNESLELKETLKRINTSGTNNKCSLGSLVNTDQGSYYLAVAAGKLVVDEKVYFAISPMSPIGSLLMGLSAGDSVTFNGKKFKIDEVL